MKNKKSAFTLIEIAATTAIIGVLVVGVMSFSGGIIKSVENFKEKYPSFSYNKNEDNGILFLDGSKIEDLDNIVYGASFTATVDAGLIKFGATNGSCSQVNDYVVLDKEIDLSKSFSIVIWSNGMSHISLGDYSDPFSSSPVKSNFEIIWKRWTPNISTSLYDDASRKMYARISMSPSSRIIQTTLTYDAETRILTSYIEGTQNATYTYPEGNKLSGTAYLSLVNREQRFDSYCAVEFDSVLVDNTKAYSASEISALYSAGSP